jgi:hypothetical protein
MNAKTKPNPTESYETIKLGIDAHAKWFYVARQLDGATPECPKTRLQRRLLILNLL